MAKDSKRKEQPCLRILVWFSCQLLVSSSTYVTSLELSAKYPDVDLHTVNLPLYETATANGRGKQPIPIPGVSDECRTVLHVFSERVANFTSCMVENARPLTFCKNCVEEYLLVQSWYQNITLGSGANCDTELLNQDHLLVVQSLARDINYYWSTAKCENCYSHENPEGSEPKLCSNTIEFFKKLANFTSCINSTEVLVENSEVVNTTVVCKNCHDVYLDLNKFYEDMNTKYNNRLCMDVVDAMNITRHMWSSTYMCNNIYVSGLTVMLSSAGFMFLPLIYYCSNKYVGIAKDTKLFPQKRMSFVQNSYNSLSLQR